MTPRKILLVDKVTDYFVKPFDLDQLLVYIRKYLT